MRIESNWIVNLLIVETHFNIGKNWVQNVVYMNNKRNWNHSFLFCRRRFDIRFSLNFGLCLHFFGLVSFLTKAPDKFQFQIQLHLSQINILVPIRLIFKLDAVFIEWGTRICFSFLGRQDIANYWDFLQKNSNNCHKRFVPEITRHDLWERFVRMSPRHRLICFAIFD